MGRRLGAERTKTKYAMDEEVKVELGKRANLVSEFAITDENMKKEIAERKNWTATGIDGIQNFWWKKIKLA